LIILFDPVFSKILVAFDGSAPSKRALDYAVKMAAMLHGELIILTVVPRAPFPILAEEGSSVYIGKDYDDYQEKIREIYRMSLVRAEAAILERYSHLKYEVVLSEGRPSAMIIDEAERRDVSLIILGSRGLGGIAGWILGSTSRKVVDQCTKPVFVIK
jgi:nucleotide-binding universal stress UspA family protein